MPRSASLQTNFSSGEIAPGLLMRRDTQQYRDGAKSLFNRRCLLEGGTCRRPGSIYVADVPGASRLEEWVVDTTTSYIAVFSDGRVDFFTSAGASAGNLTGCPWTGTMWQEMDYEQLSNTAFIAHQSFMTQVITRTGASSWARADLSFITGPSGNTYQPFYKTAEDAVTITPSDVTGSVTLTSSAALFVAGHVGKRFKWQNKELNVTGFTSSTQVTATVIERLPPTYNIVLTAAATGFIDANSIFVGDVVEGTVSGARGVVTVVNTGTNTITVLLDTTQPFAAIGGSGRGGDAGTGVAADDRIAAPGGAAKITSTTVTTPAASKVWSEQLVSSVRGYPGVVKLHRGRLMLAGHTYVPNGIMGSRPGIIYDFDVGEGADGDGFFATIGEDFGSTIVDLISAEQLIIITDGGMYYIPETATNPIRPSSLAFFAFGDKWKFGRRPKAVHYDGGIVVAVEDLIIKAKPTGDTSRMWVAEEVSLLASHLISSPIDISVCSNFDGGPERYCVITNSDGTIAVMQMVESQKLRNFTPWERGDSAGLWISTASLAGTIYSVVNEDGDHYLEIFRQDVTLDSVTSCANEAALVAADPGYSGGGIARVVTQDNNFHLGPLPLAGDFPPAGPYWLGYTYESVIETMPPVIESQAGQKTGELMRIIKAEVHVMESARFAAEGYELEAYQVTDDPTIAPPVKNGPQRFRFLGWERMPTLSITQIDPLPLTVLAIEMEIAH
jgi:hypothetical protein